MLRSSSLLLGFVAAHTLPVLYEKYEDEIDGFVDKLLNRMTHHYKKVDARFLSKMPTRKYWGKKHEWKKKDQNLKACL